MRTICQKYEMQAGPTVSPVPERHAVSGCPQSPPPEDAQGEGQGHQSRVLVTVQALGGLEEQGR